MPINIVISEKQSSNKYRVPTIIGFSQEISKDAFIELTIQYISLTIRLKISAILKFLQILYNFTKCSDFTSDQISK